ncbi:MAG: SDR family oxidoreductase [Gammaproteobacteria bacterium]
MSPLPSRDRPVLLLGAGSDIAQALAHAFARAGHPIQLAGRQPEALATVKADIEVRYRVPVSLHRFDALVTGGHRAFMQALQPPPHIVISAIGLLGEQARSETDPQAAELVMRSNYIGPCLALEAAAELLRGIDGPTAIVGISSVAGDRGRAQNYYYGSAKAGFTQFLSGLRQRLSRSQVQVLTVKPGFVRTKMTAGMPLPGALTSTPEALAERVKRALERKRHVIYSAKWRTVMTIVRAIPEGIFKNMRF